MKKVILMIIISVIVHYVNGQSIFALNEANWKIFEGDHSKRDIQSLIENIDDDLMIYLLQNDLFESHIKSFHIVDYDFDGVMDIIYSGDAGSNSPRTLIFKGFSPPWWGFSLPQRERPRPKGRSVSPGRESPPWRTSPSFVSRCLPSSTGTLRSALSMPCSTALSPRFSTPASTRRSFFLSSSPPHWWEFSTRSPDTPPRKRSRGFSASWPFEHLINGFSPSTARSMAPSTTGSSDP